MNIKSLAVLVALSVGSTAAVANPEWMSDTAEAQIKAEVINSLEVRAPDPLGENKGNVGRIEVGKTSLEKQLDFSIKATAGYTLDLEPEVTSLNDCDKVAQGSNGYVTLTKREGETVEAPSNNFFIQPIYYTYTAPATPVIAMCEVKLIASYQ